MGSNSEVEVKRTAAPHLHLFLPDNLPGSCTHLIDHISPAISLPFTQIHGSQSPRSVQDSFPALHGVLVESNLPTRQSSSSETFIFQAACSTNEVLAGHAVEIMGTALSGKAGAAASTASFELDFSSKSATKGAILTESKVANRGTRSWLAPCSSAGTNLNTQTKHAQIWGPVLRIPAENQLQLQERAGRDKSRSWLPERSVGYSSRPPDNPSKKHQPLDVQQLELSSFQRTRCGEQVIFSPHESRQLELSSFQSIHYGPQSKVSSRVFMEQPAKPWMAMDLNVPIGENEFNAEERSTAIEAIMFPTDNESFGTASISSCTTTTSVKSHGPCRSGSQEDIGSLLSLSSRFEPDNLSSTTLFPACVPHRNSTRMQGLASLIRTSNKQSRSQDRPSKMSSRDFLKLGLPMFSEICLESCTQGMDSDDSYDLKEKKGVHPRSSIIESAILENTIPDFDQGNLVKNILGMLPSARPHASEELDLLLGHGFQRSDPFAETDKHLIPESIASHQSQLLDSFIGAHQHEVQKHHILYDNVKKDCVIDLELRLFMPMLL